MRTTKFAALVAAVALLVVGAAFASFAATGWVPEGDDWYYYDKEDVMADSCWRESNGGWYWLDESGVMEKEAFVEWKEKTFYVNETGLMVTGWQKIYDEDDEADYWYYFQPNGAAYTNTKKECPTADGSHTYIFDSNGRMLSGWVELTEDKDEKYSSVDPENYESALYYCGDENDGAVVLADWRYLNVAAEDEDDDNAWFYFQASGKKAYGDDSGNKILTIDGKKYAFDKTGKMVTEWADATPASSSDIISYYDADGAQVTSGWFQAYSINTSDDDFDEDEYDLNWYYAISKKEVAKDRFVLDGGKLYLLGDDGALVSGLQYVTFNTDELGNKNVKSVVAVGSEDGDYIGSELGATDPTAFKYLYYFNEEHDGTFGALKTGNVTVVVDGDDTTFKFDGGSKIAKGAGIATQGFDGSYYYTEGQELAGDEDYKYCAVKVKTFTAKGEGATKLSEVELKDTNLVTAKELCGSSEWTKSDSENYVVITSKGNFVKTLNKTDEDDYKWVVKNYILQSVKYITED